MKIRASRLIAVSVALAVLGGGAAAAVASQSDGADPGRSTQYSRVWPSTCGATSTRPRAPRRRVHGQRPRPPPPCAPNSGRRRSSGVGTSRWTTTRCPCARGGTTGTPASGRRTPQQGTLSWEPTATRRGASTTGGAATTVTMSESPRATITATIVMVGVTGSQHLCRVALRSFYRFRQQTSPTSCAPL